MRPVMLFCVLLLPACADSGAPAGAPTADIAWYDGSFDDALAQARATQRRVVVDFWTTWCGYCKKLDRETFPDPAVVAEMEKLIPLSIDAESPAGAPLAKRYGVKGFPTILVVDPTGREVGRITGFLPPKPFAEQLAALRDR